MRKIYLLFFLILAAAVYLHAQCPPPGFPDSGNTCPDAPILCENLDGYCNTINNNNVQQNFPGCSGNWVLNNDEWFAFFAGTTTITIQITPTNCTNNGSNIGLQGGIYHGCGGAVMDVQCSCTANPFILTSSNYVVGDIYWFVLDGCAGDVCDYSIDVLSGSTVPFPPNIDSPVSGPNPVCAGTNSTYSIQDVSGASTYNWTMTPSSLGTLTGGNDHDVVVHWGANASGDAEICVTVGNYCYPNADSECTTVHVTPKPTATLSGSGVICTNGGGTVNLTVTFTGEAPWQFTPTLNGVPQAPITTSDNPYTFTVNQAGTWGITNLETVGSGCHGTTTGTSTVTAVTLTHSATTVASTCGQSNGSLDFTVGGGTPPYTYMWSNGATTQDQSNIPGGTYTVTVTDNNGCTVTHTVTVPDNTITINISGVTQPNTVCNSSNNGSINVTVNPGGTYTYMWSNGATTEDLSNLPPGTYTITVTSGVTCTNSASFTINDQPNNPNATYTTVQTTCDLSNGSINLTVNGGVAPYTFNWSNGATTEDLSNIPAGSYQVTVTGANGCTTTASVNVTNNNPVINLNSTVMANTNCNGTGNGSINITVNPSGTYTYNWSNGSSTQNLSNLLPGTYSLTVTGQGSCSQTIDVTVPDNPLNPNVTYTTVQSTCDLANGSINVTANGGVAPYTYMWSNGATTQNLSNILAGSYSLTVTGANGCTHQTDITVSNNNPPINVSGNIMGNTTCNGTNNGAINVTVTPPAAYTYLWSNGSTSLNQTGLAPGSYTLTVTGQGSCSTVMTFDVPQNANVPNVTSTVTQTTCDLANGNININVNGSVPPYQFNWSNGATSQNLSNILAGNYTITVTGANGCSTVLDVNVPNFNPPINVSAVVTDNTTCTGANGSINVSVSPPANYTYTWSNGATSQDLSNIPPGTYTITVSNGGTCVEVHSFDVYDNPNDPNLSYTQVDANCGLSNGSINLSVNGGVGPYTYIWSNGAVTQDLNNIPADVYSVTVTGANGCTSVEGVGISDNVIPIDISGIVNGKTSCITNNGTINLNVTPSSASITWENGAHGTTRNNLAPGTYSVTVSMGGTCTETASFDVYDETDYPIPSTDVTEAYCSIATGAIDLEINGGAAPYTYKWSNNAMTQDISNLLAGTYTVTVTSSLGCTATTTAVVPNNDVPINLNGIVYDNLACVPPLNGAIDLEIDPDIYTYNITWSNGLHTQNLANLSPGMYTVTVKLGTTCSATATYEVLNAAVAPNASAAGVSATCGLSNGGANLTASGASSPYTFHWSNGASTEDLSNVPPGTYSVTVTDFYGCTATTSATVSNNNIALNVTASTVPNTSCAASNGSINISVVPAGGYTYHWSNNASTEDVSGLAAGTYTVTVTAGTSCSATASFTVTNNTSNPVIAPAITPAICSNPDGGIDLTISGGTAPYNFHWTNNASTEDLSGILPGTYNVTVTDANGCTADTLLAVPNNSSTFSLAGNTVHLTDCVTPNGSVNLTVTPAGGYTYAWSNGATTEDVSNLTAGVYTVSVTETGTCTASISFVVSDNRTYPSLNQNVVEELCNLMNGAVDLTVSGGALPYTYAWSSGQSSQDLNGIADGTYSVTVTGSNHCSATAVAVVPDNSVSFAISATPVNNTSCVANNGAIDITLNPSTPGSGLSYTYAWSNSTSNEDLSSLSPGVYTVTVSAGGTCTQTASYNVQNNTQAPTLSQAVTPAFCGQNSGSVDLTTSGGQSPYTFAWSNATTNEDLTGVTSGAYTVTVTGSNGCSTSNSYNIPENVTIPAITTAITANTSCVSNNGGINLNVTPALTYTFNWSNGQTTQNLQNLPGGTYTVTVSAGGGCTAVSTVTVPNNIVVVSLSGTPTNVKCFGESTGAINLNVNTGTAPFNYAWTPAAGNVEDLANLPAGTYNVTVTDVNGCSASTSFTVTQPAGAVQIMCHHVSDITSPTATDGKGSVDISGGTPPYTVDWNPGGQQNNVVPGVFNINNLTQGTYQVIVTDANGCSAVCSFDIGLVPCTTAVGTMPNATVSLCGNGCITANYDATGQFLDPNDGLQFILHTGSGNQIVNEITRSNQPVFCFNPATMQYGTTYYVSAVAGNTDANGNVLLNAYCTVISLPTPIVFYQKPVAAIAPPMELNCRDHEVNLIGSSSLPGAVFAWTTNGGTITGSASQPNTKAGKAGDYMLEITVNGCKDTANVVVNDITNNPLATIAASPDDLLDCKIDQITLLGTAEGTQDANMIWISGGNIYTPGTTLHISDPGDYQFVILDTLTHCSDTANITINQNLAYPPLFVNPPATLTCLHPSVVLNGGSPFPGVQFKWAKLNGLDTVIVGTGTSLTVNAPGTFLIIGYDPNNQCQNSLSVTVDANQTIPTADAGQPFSIKCFGETANLNGSGSTSGSGLLSFLWTTSNGVISNGATSANPLISKPGTYLLLVTDPTNGCTATDNVLINPIDPTATMTVVQPPCYGDKGTINIDEVNGGKPPVLYSLNDAPFTAQNFFTNLGPGPYTVVVQDAEGCSTTLSAVIVEPDEFKISVVPQATISLGETYQIITQINVTPDKIQSVQWTPSTGLSCDTCLILYATPFVSTQYKVEVKTEAGCRDDGTLRLLVDRRVDVYIPNVFSPNGDGNNDFFTVYADTKGVTKIHSLQVYSRWGELLWERFDFEPNNPTIGWDGKFRGQDMNPAVFVYQAVVEFIDGHRELFKGDVTIER